jgi:hypothetical protein
MDEALQLSVTVTAHTATAVCALREARGVIPCAGSLAAALDRADPAGLLHPNAFAEALEALDVAARVFGHRSAIVIGAHHPDAALVFDVAVYHLTGAPGDVPAALIAFRRAAGPPLPGLR